MKERKIRMNEYRENLLANRQREVLKKDIINEFNHEKGRGLTSPTTATTTEETRLLMEYIDRANMFNLSKQDSIRGKALKLKKFFKSKRNQQVEVYFHCGEKSRYSEGKVSAIGRDFVMLTNLKERMWIPYSVIDSANIPYGIPNYSNTHQHFIFDNNLRNKLINRFGETVSKRDLLMQQFYEETLQTNLNSWRETWVIVYLDEKTKKFGKLLQCKDSVLLMSFYKDRESILLKEIKYVETLRMTTLFTHIYKTFIRNGKKD